MSASPERSRAVPPASSPSDERARQASLIRVGTFALFGFAAVAAARLFSLEIYSLCLALGFSVLAGLLNLVWMDRGAPLHRVGQVGVAVLYGMLLVSNLSTGGFYDPNFGWFYVVPICAALLIDLRAAVMWGAVVVATNLMFWGVAGSGIELPHVIPLNERHNHALFNRVMALSALVALAASFVANHADTARALFERNHELAIEARCVEVLQQAAVAANEADDFDAALEACAHGVVRATGWKLANVYAPAADGSGEFAHRYGWQADDGDYADLARLCRDLRIRPGHLALGRLIERIEPAWATREDLGGDVSPRARAALAVGLGCAVAVPVDHRGEVLAILEFLGTEEDHPDTRLIAALRGVGRQLGRVAERLRLQETLRRSQKLESVGQLAAGIAHEVNNPLAFVRANLGMLRGDWGELQETAKRLPGSDALLAELADCEQAIVESLEGVDRIVSIVREVREFARDAHGSAEWADLEPMLAGSLRIASTQVRGGTEIVADVDPSIRLHCRPTRMQQAFLNLIVNGLQSMSDGGTLRVTARRHDGAAVVSIEDRGHGIAEDDLERIFEPFFTTKPSGDGTGLGLYVSHEILRAHGAEIEVDSTPGQGTRFTLRLPLASE